MEGELARAIDELVDALAAVRDKGGDPLKALGWLLEGSAAEREMLKAMHGG